ncbi:MAG: hypothetical protein ACLUUG_12715 [Lachnospiraceae bacterium]
MWVVGSVLIIGMLIMIPLVKLGIQSRVNKNHLDESEIQNIINEHFRTGENIIYDSEVEYDLRDVLGSELIDMKSTLEQKKRMKYATKMEWISIHWNVDCCSKSKKRLYKMS